MYFCKSFPVATKTSLKSRKVTFITAKANNRKVEILYLYTEYILIL